MFFHDFGITGDVVDEVSASGGIAGAGEGAVEEVTAESLAFTGEPLGGGGVNGGVIDEGVACLETGADGFEDFADGEIVAQEAEDGVCFGGGFGEIKD